MPTTSAAPDAGSAAVPAWPAPPWLPRWCRIAVLLVIEDQAGRHATGRSAAMFFEGYGNQTVRALTRASRAFLERPPEGFSEVPLMTPRAAMMVADAEGAPRLFGATREVMAELMRLNNQPASSRASTSPPVATATVAAAQTGEAK